jgi:protease IV
MKKLFAVFSVLCLLAVASTVAGILMSRGKIEVGGPRVLVWHVEGPIVEHVMRGLNLPGYEPPDSIASLFRAFRAAREDSRVRGVAVYIEDTGFGLAKAQELRRQLAALRASGKFAKCYLETAGEGSNGTLAYYLATACDSIALAPAGEVNLLGLRADSTFVRGTLDKLRIAPAFRHVGAYKSASETYTETQHSPAAREAIENVLDVDYRQIVDAIADARKLPADTVRGIIDAAPYGAERAKELGLVDAVVYPDGFRDDIEAAAGGDPDLVSIERYDHRPRSSGKRLAVVFAEGTILRGGGGIQPWTEEAFLGSADLGPLLRDLGEDDDVAGVVLRIDSPGGSALASDLILREVERLASQKPVVVSMSDVAASGGYYIASKATKILAEPGTITGSIGVVAGKLATRRFQQELLGISHDEILRGKNAGLYSTLDDFSPEQDARFMEQMQRIYGMFVGHVAAGRKMTTAAVEKIAAGRVWTGEDALRLGLVDELGGLDRAVEIAQEAARLPAGASPTLQYYPEQPSVLEVLFGERRPALPAELKALLELAAPRPTFALELPPELRGLTRPF